MDVFSSIMRDEFQLKIKVANAIRLGRKFGPKNRLMLVTLESVEDKKAILRLAKDLRNSPTWSNVYISLDQTPKERVLSRELRTELRTRRDAGENNIVIRFGKIIKGLNRARPQARPQEAVHATPSVVAQVTPLVVAQDPPQAAQAPAHVVVTPATSQD